MRREKGRECYYYSITFRLATTAKCSSVSVFFFNSNLDLTGWYVQDPTVCTDDADALEEELEGQFIVKINASSCFVFTSIV